MSDTLVLIGGDAPTAPMAWVRVSQAGEISQRGVVDDAPPPATSATRTILVLPGADARLKPLDLPTRSEAQARAGAAALSAARLALKMISTLLSARRWTARARRGWSRPYQVRACGNGLSVAEASALTRTPLSWIALLGQRRAKKL
ncbi:MAG: hypothetical protein M0D54_09170 [Hyphomonadaceae bacterium JAD_PAG50586_4]|nr:MAG: hypothetical protein M0D54_09170 [Hyphomonadaceae bacterium JAD_PAG50586_4]